MLLLLLLLLQVDVQLQVVAERLESLQHERTSLLRHVGQLEYLIESIPADLAAMKLKFSGDSKKSLKTLFADEENSFSKAGAFYVMSTIDHARYLFCAGYTFSFLGSGVSIDIWHEECIESCGCIFSEMVDEADMHQQEAEFTQDLFYDMTHALRTTALDDPETCQYATLLAAYDRLDNSLMVIVSKAKEATIADGMTLVPAKILQKMKMYLLTGRISTSGHAKSARDLIREHSDGGCFLLVPDRPWRDDIEANSSVKNDSGQIKVGKQNVGMCRGAEVFSGLFVRLVSVKNF